MPDREILGVRVSGMGQEELEQDLLSCVRGNTKSLFAYVNVHAVNTARRDPRFREILNSSHISYCDGEGVRLGARILGWRLPRRIVLTYWIWDLCALFEKEGVSIFLLGARPGVAEYAASRLVSSFPHLRIAGVHPGYFNKEGAENDSVIAAIEKASPDVLFVGFGMPLQELWVEENFRRITARAILTAGSMIDYVAGVKKTTPGWMADHGMEWLYRLAQDPVRLWKRYLLGNPVFLFKILMRRGSTRET